jgi:transcriptional regulator with XRE-family HTH domain
VPRSKHSPELDLTLFHRLGTALRFLREHQGKTAKSVAEAAGVTAPMLSAYENERSVPELATLDRVLAHGLRLTLPDLVWALDVVNQAQGPEGAAREPRSMRSLEPAGPAARRAGVARPRPAASGDTADDPLTEALEQGYEEILRGLTRLSRAVFDSVSLEARRGEPR